MILLIYLILHSPAIILLIIGLFKLNREPERAKKLLLIALIYFIIGGGICSSILSI